MAGVLDVLALHPALVSADRLALREGRGVVSTGVPALDETLDGGWPRGALCELVGERSSGRTALLLASLRAALLRQETTALVDAAGTFDPGAATRAELPLEHLLWVRGPRSPLQATEQLLDAGGFGLVALDLGEAPPRAPTAAWIRLKQVAEKHGAVVLVVASRRPQGAGGRVALGLRRGAVTFHGGPGAGPALFAALEVAVALERGRQRDEGPRAPRLRLVHDLG
jgi:hypothetical protein